VPKPVASDKPVGIVIDQNPKAGADVKKNSSVTISVSGGLGDAAIPPDLTSKSVAGATKALTDAKFQVKVDSPQSSTTVNPGNVIATIPAYPSSAPVGSVVHIIPSSGITVPNVVNLPQAQAASQLTQVGFEAPQVITESSNSIGSGNVTRTDPPAGTPNRKGGSPIKMYVSTGAAQVTVPDVRGMAVGKAQTTLSDNNLQSSVVFEASSKGNDGKVISQDPISGVLRDPQSTVVLTVGTYTAPPPPTGTTVPAGGPTTTGP
jgi:serine/threonine-protein kinase